MYSERNENKHLIVWNASIDWLSKSLRFILNGYTRPKPTLQREQSEEISEYCYDL